MLVHKVAGDMNIHSLYMHVNNVSDRIRSQNTGEVHVHGVINKRRPERGVRLRPSINGPARYRPVCSNHL